MTSYLENLTPEERAANLERARIASEARKAEFQAKAHLLKSDFADKPYWRKLASKHGVRMPADYIPGSESRYIRRAMKRATVSADHVREAFGGDVKYLARENPTWPAFALIGLILELAEDKPFTATESADDLI